MHREESQFWSVTDEQTASEDCLCILKLIDFELRTAVQVRDSTSAADGMERMRGREKKEHACYATFCKKCLKSLNLCSIAAAPFHALAAVCFCLSVFCWRIRSVLNWNPSITCSDNPPTTENEMQRGRWQPRKQVSGDNDKRGQDFFVCFNPLLLPAFKPLIAFIRVRKTAVRWQTEKYNNQMT